MSKSNLFQTFKTDADLLKTGVWFDLDGAKFRCGFHGRLSRRFAAAADRVYSPVRHRMQTGTVSQDEYAKLEREVFVFGTLLDWKDVEGEDGKPLAFTTDAALELFEKLPFLQQVLEGMASELKSYRHQGDSEADAKNS